MVLMKLIAIPVVVLVLLAGFLTTNPAVSGFFEQMKDKFFSFTKIEPPVNRNIDFTVDLNKYNTVTFDRSSPMNITVIGEASVVLQNGNVNTKNGITLVDYKGFGSVSNKLLLNGTYERLESMELKLGKGKIWLESNFSNTEITNLRVKIINISDVSGVLTLKNSSTQFSGSIEIFEPLGTFTFDNSRMTVKGTTQKITIPSVGINIG
ncbi:hypothetical protein HYZ41_04630 [archaeon]|nr:hypothetical protein [archaeon]